MSVSYLPKSKHPAGAGAARTEALVELLEIWVKEADTGSHRFALTNQGVERLRALADHEGLTCEQEWEQIFQDRFVGHLKGFADPIIDVTVMTSRLAREFGFGVKGECGICQQCVTWIIDVHGDHVLERCLRCMVRWFAQALEACECGDYSARVKCQHSVNLEDDEPDPEDEDALRAANRAWASGGQA